MLSDPEPAAEHGHDNAEEEKKTLSAADTSTLTDGGRKREVQGSYSLDTCPK